MTPDSTAEASDQSSSTIKKLVFSASLWAMAGSLAGQVLSFVIFVILARLLSPYEFGLVAFLAVFIDLARGVIVGGIPEALIQRKQWSEQAANTAFWLNLISTLAFVVVAVAVALVIPQSSTVSQTAWIFVALSLTLTIDGSRAVHEAYLRRHFAYKSLAMRTVIASIVGGVVGIVAALAGLGVWSLVVQRVVSSVIQSATIWKLADFRPSFKVAWSEARTLLTFSSTVMASRLVGQVNQRVPDLVIGSIAGPAALGLFRVGTRSLNFLVQALVSPLHTTTLPAFARLKDRESVARAYSRFTQLCAVVTFPAFLGSAAIADDFIGVFFGEKWSAGAWIMVALSLAVVPRSLYQFFQPAMQAIGKPQNAIAPEITRLGVGVVLVTGAAFFGPLAAASADTLRSYLTIPQSLRILRREIGLAPSQLLKGIAIPFLCAAAMSLTIVVLRMTWLYDWPPVARLPVCVAVGAGAYLVFMMMFARRFVIDLAASMRHGLPQKLQILLDRLLAIVRLHPSNAARSAQ